MPDPIYFLSKSDAFSEFSNFHESPLHLDGKTWPTVEHYFQAAKFPSDPAYQERIRTSPNPTTAKKLGQTRSVPLRADWDTHRDTIMERALRAKFSENRQLRELLLSTGDRPLIENNKRDSYWGIGTGNGLNKLGHALVSLRTTLRNQ
jgi:ribA/ribD-fused uncharacterized protein